jgi:hypothetical protein
VREAAAPATGVDAPPTASRLGGMLLIAGVLVAVAVVLFLVLRGGDDPAGEQVASSPTPAASATPAATATPQVADAIPLRSTTAGQAKGTMTVFLQDGRLLFALEAQDVPPSGERAADAVWFTGSGGKARRLGFTNPVGADGRLAIQGPSERDLEDFRGSTPATRRSWCRGRRPRMRSGRARSSSTAGCRRAASLVAASPGSSPRPGRSVP